MMSDKGARRRQAIVDAAAELLREGGPQAVSHRTVARRVGCSLSSTTYYFDGLDELLAEAGRVNIAQWAARAEAVAERAEDEPVPTDRDGVIDLAVAAGLPADVPPLPHYLQLIAAGSSEPVARAYRTGRHRLNGAFERLLARVGSSCPPELAIAVIDGAVVTALSEGRDVRDTVRELLDHVL